MKRFFSLLLVLTLGLALCPAAAGADAPEICVSSQTLTVDGAEVRCQAYNVDGYNYFRLRDLAMLLRDTDSRFSVSYSSGERLVSITAGGDYVPNGSETPKHPRDESAGGVRSTQRFAVGGREVEGLSVWNFGGSNYFKLAELASRLGFRVSYDSEARAVRIETGLPHVAKPEVKTAASYAEILAGLGRSGARNGGVWLAEDAAAPMDGGAVAEEAPSASDGSASEYSGTNVQVEGVDEGDIVKTDGRYIYVLNTDWEEETLTILRADGSSTAVVSRTRVGAEETREGTDGWSSERTYPSEMFVENGVLALISDRYSYAENKAGGYWRYDTEERSIVELYDVSDPAAPKKTAALGQDGSVLASRLLDGKLYLVSAYRLWDWDEDDPGSYVPCLYENGSVRTMASDRVSIVKASSSEYVVTGCYDLASGSLLAGSSLLGGGGTVYMSGDSLYVFGTQWREEETGSHTESVYSVTEYRSGYVTDIFRFDLGSLSLAASGSVPGMLDDQFSADEWNGHLRLVSTQEESEYRVYRDEAYDFTNWQWIGDRSGAGLYILDRSLDLVGAVTDLAQGERVYSARFDGAAAYFSTFRTIDPLFAVDCSDPAHPAVLSALKISGFSEYLHPWTAGRLFGFGREADPDTGAASGLKLVMFDTSDPTNVAAKHTLELEESYGEALYDHHAIFISAERNIIGFLAGNTYRVYAYDDAAGFRPVCAFSFESSEYSVRGLYIGGWAYIVGGKALMAVDMDTWTDRTLVSYA